MKLKFLLSLLTFIFLLFTSFSFLKPLPFPKRAKSLRKEYDASTIRRIVRERGKKRSEVFKLLSYQIGRVEETVDRSQKTLAVDEALRFQLWDLSETIEFANQFYKQDPTMTALVRTAEKLGKKGLVSYNRLTEAIETQLKKKSISLLEVESLENNIPLYATGYEQVTQAPEWKKDKVKCGATARGLLYYFSQKEGVDLKKANATPLVGFENFQNALREHYRHKNERVLYLCDSKRLDHVFVIEQTPEGRFRFYQSFVNTYSLKADFAMEETLSYEELSIKLAELETILKAEKWDKEIAQRYEHLFFSQPHPQFQGQFQKQAPDLSVVVLAK